MIKKLRLERFKGFREAELGLGPLTLLVGANGSGKSNLRDAFRVLHGVSRGYTVAEILGQKWIEGGVLQWEGIRGGTREATFQGSPTFALEAMFTIPDRSSERDAAYRIEIDVGTDGKAPRVAAERLIVSGRGQFMFDSHPESNPPAASDAFHLPIRLRKEGKSGWIGPQVNFINTKPVLSQIPEHPEVRLPSVREFARLALQALASMQFLDLRPEALRLRSLPGQVILGDRGENLSSVLQAICQDDRRKKALLDWLKELTPMDAADFEFAADESGRILVSLVDTHHQKISAYSASDGTLRFLAMIAALLGPQPARFYFYEELDTGIHPTRLHLLVDLIERQAATGTLQMVATTHSPQLLAVISPKTLEYAALTYQTPDIPEARIRRILDIPEARRILEKKDLSRLHASGWLETAVYFTDEAREPE